MQHQNSKKKISFIYFLFGIILYLLIVVLIWPHRTFYDDELLNLSIISKYDFASLIKFISRFDYHPPGQYIINKIFYSLFGTNEWLLSLPSLISTGLTAGLIGVILYEITSKKLIGWIGLILCVFNPLILMWGYSIRWYPVWTFLSLLSIYLVFKYWLKDSLVLLSLSSFLIILGLYINYLTFIVIFSILFLSVIFNSVLTRSFSFKNIFGGYFAKSFKSLIIVFILFLPWVGSFINHLTNFLSQKNITSHNIVSAGGLSSAGYFLYTVFIGPSSFPWNNLTLIFIALAVISFSGIFIMLIRQGIIRRILNKIKFTINSKNDLSGKIIFFWLIIASVIFILFLIYSILIKSFNSDAYLLIPFLIVLIVVCISFYFLKYHNKFNKLTKYFIISFLSAFLVLWIIGDYNIVQKIHLHKMGLSDPVLETINIVNNEAGVSSKSAIVITTNPVITFYLMKEDNQNILLLSPYKKLYQNIFRNSTKDLDTVSHDRLNFNIIFIDTYLGYLMPYQREYGKLFKYIKENGQLLSSPRFLNNDFDYKMKSLIFPDEELVKWRIKIFYFKPIIKWNMVKLLAVENWRKSL